MKQKINAKYEKIPHVHSEKLGTDSQTQHSNSVRILTVLNKFKPNIIYINTYIIQSINYTFLY